MTKRKNRKRGTGKHRRLVRKHKHHIRKHRHPVTRRRHAKLFRKTRRAKKVGHARKPRRTMHLTRPKHARRAREAVPEMNAAPAIEPTNETEPAISRRSLSGLMTGIVRELRARRGGGEGLTGISKVDLLSLKSQLEELRRELELSEVESHREVAEKFGGLSEDLERHIVEMESEINDLKSAMVRLSGELKRVKGSGA